MFHVLLTGFSIFILFLIVHVSLFLIFKSEKFAANIKTLSAIMLFCSFFLVPLGRWIRSFSFVSEPLGFVLLSTFVFTFIWFGYLQFYFLFERGISTRILAMLSREDASTADFEKIFPLEEVLKNRLEQMKRVNLIEVSQGNHGARYRNFGLGKLIGRFSDWYKRTFNLGT